jgi:uncharacterized protein (TIGR02996 family)
MDRVTEFLETEFPNAEERALLLGIADAPTDKTAKLVYADWLDERSDPRGEYVRLLAMNGRKKPTARMIELRKGCSGPWLSMMGELNARFEGIAREVEEREDDFSWADSSVELHYHCGLWWFHYVGNLWLDEEAGGLAPVLDFLSDPQIAPVLFRVSLHAYDEHPRTNGTLAVSLWPLTETVFPHLESLDIEQSQNTILCDSSGRYQEGGQGAALLNACPRLLRLALPSAPDTTFFTGPPHPLETLDIHSGYATQEFIPSLTASKRFAKLRHLAYKDFCCEYTRPEPYMRTPFAEWEAFFRSPACAALEEIKLSGVVLTQAEVRALLDIRSTGVSITRSSAAP